MSTPKVSVLMTAYNSEAFIAETIESVLAQTMQDFEFIIVDDGSTDQSLAIIRKYAAKDARIKVVSRPNTGIPKAANDGLAICVGEVVARIDSDDVAMPHRFSTQLACLKKSGAVCVGCFVDYMDAKGRFLTTLRSPVDNDSIQRALLAGHCALWHTGSMYIRDAVEKVGGYDEDFDCALDLDLWLRLGEFGELRNVPQSLQYYRLHHQSVSESKGRRQREMSRMACERAWQRRGIQGCFEADELWRPGRDRHSRQHFALQYGWWAFNSGQRRTAMIYGAEAILHRPIHPGGWWLLVCATLKKGPGSKST